MPNQNSVDEIKIKSELAKGQRRRKIDEEIEELQEWMRKYPRAKMSRTVIPKDILREYVVSEEDYERLLEEYVKLQKYYNYVCSRKSRGKLSMELELKCKEANLGGVLGYSTYIENLAKKYRNRRKKGGLFIR